MSGRRALSGAAVGRGWKGGVVSAPPLRGVKSDRWPPGPPVACFGRRRRVRSVHPLTLEDYAFVLLDSVAVHNLTPSMAWLAQAANPQLPVMGLPHLWQKPSATPETEDSNR